VTKMKPTIKKRWQKHALSLAAICFIFGLMNASSNPMINRQPDSLEAFTAYLNERIPALMSRYNIPGASIALVRGGKLAWSNAYGYANLKEKRPMTVHSVCRAESISKSVTAWGVMKLVEQGFVELDAPVQRYLRHWKLPDSEFDEQTVTVRMLLSASAGMPLGEIGKAVEYVPQSEMPSLQDYLTREARLMQKPGAGYLYSNVGFNLLELLVEEVTGLDFAEYMENEVLRPLGMNTSSFAWDESFGSLIPNGHELNGAPVHPYVYPTKASGGLFTSVEDIARFISSGMTGHYYASYGVLSQDILRQMHIPQVKVAGIYRFVAESYGFGYFIETLPSGQKAVWHGGQGHGWMTHFHSVPETGDGIVILTNSQRSWPFIADLLSEWRSWNNFGSVKFEKIIYATTASWIFIGLVALLSLTLTVDLVKDIVKGTLKFAPFAADASHARLFKVATGMSITAFLSWRISQPYLLETSIFPASAGWAGIALLALSVVLIISALFSRFSRVP
jgi:CubicO group peptidase (beta-lactamase class C family)